jgi:cellulose synthase (UDP-forming)
MAEKSKGSAAMSWLAGIVVGTMLATSAFMVVRITLFLLTEGEWYDRMAAAVLLFAECFYFLNCLGYFGNVFRVLTRPRGDVALPDDLPELEEYPEIAIAVASYKEPLDVVENNLICFRNLTYPNKQIYLLDDTRYDLKKEDPAKLQEYRAAIDDLCRRIGVNLFRRRWHGAKAGMINDFLAFLEGRPLEGSELKHFQKTGKSGSEKYLAVFDADMNPLPDFAESIVQIMEKNDKIAFVQTPQYYTNFETNRVARAAGLQQVVFYEYICEGKSLQDAMICCGTNVMFRRKALVAVGGFDDTSVTEDFATSIKFHSTGWSSRYFNRICAFGMGPNDLGGYFKQQFRWALGTVGLFRPTLWKIIRTPRLLSPGRWIEYLLSSTYYFVGWAFLALLVCPVIYLFFDIPRYFAHPTIFFIFFVPYLTMTMLAFMNTLRAKNYRRVDMYNGLLLANVTFPIYMKASLLGLLGFRGKFGITPKSGSSSLPLRSLWPQLLTMTALLAAAVWGLNRIYYIREPVPALSVNVFWCLYNFWLLLTIFYFNRPEEIRPGVSISAEAKVHA